MGGHRISPRVYHHRPVRPGRPPSSLLLALSLRAREEEPVKSAEEIMEILEAFDLVGTLRGAAVLADCNHKTVARYVEARDRAGGGVRPGRRARPAAGSRAGAAAPGPGARPLDAVGPRRRADRRGAADVALLRLACLEP